MKTKFILFVSVSGEVEEEPERILPDDFYYDFDDLVSRAFSTEGIPPELLSFQYPFNNRRQYILTNHEVKMAGVKVHKHTKKSEASIHSYYMATIVRALWLAAERALFSCNDRAL